MNITIEAVLSNEEILEIVSAHVRRVSGRDILKHRLFVSPGHSGELGGASKPSTVQMIFELKDDMPS